MERRRRLRDYWSDMLQDARYGLRTFARDPGFASVSDSDPGSRDRGEYRRFQRGEYAAVAAAAVSAVAASWCASGRRRPCADFLRDVFGGRIRGVSRPESDLSGRDRDTRRTRRPTTCALLWRDEPQSATSIMVLANFFRGAGVSRRWDGCLQRTSCAADPSCRLVDERVLETGVQCRPGDCGQGH